jgi:hypothetical protein
MSARAPPSGALYRQEVDLYLGKAGPIPAGVPGGHQHMKADRLPYRCSAAFSCSVFGSNTSTLWCNGRKRTVDSV